MNLFLSGWPDSGSLLKFDLAAVRAAVRQRLCLKAVMAGVAEIVVHSVYTSNLCLYSGYDYLYLIRILLYPKVVLNVGDAFASQITDVIKRDDSRQFLLNSHSFSIAVLHDFQFSIN